MAPRMCSAPMSQATISLGSREPSCAPPLWAIFMPTSSRDDLDFFNMVHRLVEHEESPRDGRMHDRYPYPRMQLMAPMFGGRLPDPAAFREVRCFDLSATGFSYLSPTAPESGDLVIVLGTSPNLTYFKAEVVHERPYRLIGCQFTGRVEA